MKSHNPVHSDRMEVISYVDTDLHSDNRTSGELGVVGDLLENSTPDKKDGVDTSRIIIASSIAIGCSIIFIVTCTICFRRNRALRRNLALGQMIKMKTRSPFNIAPVQKQTRHPDSGEYAEPNNDINESTRIANQDKAIEKLRYSYSVSPSLCSSEDLGQTPLPSPLSIDEPRKSLTNCSITQSMADLHVLESPDTPDVMHRSCSMTNLDLSIDERAFDGVVKTTFTVCYDEWNFTLTVNLHSVSNLPTKAQSGHVFAVVCLMPDVNEKRQTKLLPCIGDYVSFEEQYIFRNVRKRILENGTIRISIYRQKRGKKGKKDSLVGELFLKCSEVDMRCNIPTRFSKLEAPRKRLTKMSTSDKLLHQHLGEFFVDLQYQSLADRLKVFVRKAIQLPPGDKLTVVKPAHYVVVKLIRDGSVVDVQKTRTSSGRNPVWNEAFLFNVDKNTDSYSLEFLVMKGKLHKKDDVLGKVEIGPNSGTRGRNHWRSMIRPRPTDVAKWHSILPVFAY